MSPKEPDPIFRTSLYFPPTMNSALEPLLLAIVGDEGGGWGPAPTPRRGGRGPLGWSPEQGCGGGRQGTEHAGFWRHRAANPPRGTRSRPPSQVSFCSAAVCAGFSRLPGWATCVRAAATASLSRRRRGLEKGRGELGR